MNIEPSTVLAFLAIMLALLTVTDRMPRIRLGRRKAPQEAVQSPPECPCGHYANYHDPATGICHSQERQDVYKRGSFDHVEYVACTCRQYLGPEILSGSNMWHPGMAVSPAPYLRPIAGPDQVEQLKDLPAEPRQDGPA